MMKIIDLENVGGIFMSSKEARTQQQQPRPKAQTRKDKKLKNQKDKTVIKSRPKPQVKHVVSHSDTDNREFNDFMNGMTQVAKLIGGIK